MQCGRRERKKAATRDRISDAALRLALTHGPDAVTVDNIAEAADVSPRTFFNHFPSKWDAIVDFDLDGHEELADAIRQRPAHESPFVALRNAALEHLAVEHDDKAKRAERMRLVETHDGLQRLFHGYFAAFEAMLIDAVVARLGPDHDPDDPYPRVLVSAVMSAVRTAVRHHVDAADDRPFVEVATEVFDILAAGFTRAPSPSSPSPKPPKPAGPART